MGHVIIGTAGHIDHGKSSLVRALTGTDPDRLPEEKRRQITIDLGYAFLDDVAAIIDVPGHEKFIHNMVAGATTIDFAILVIASDDGIMPQTREHLHILRLLGLKHGTIVLTKIGMTEADWRTLVKEQIRSTVRDTFLANANIFEVDSLSGTGIPELRTFLLSELPKLPLRSTSDVLRIPIDSVFNVHGHGTVVTGTVLSGTVEREQKLELLPGRIPARVKQLQSNAHEQTVIKSGMRAALNLNTDALPIRGQTLTTPGSLTSSRRLAVSFEQIPDAPHVKDRQRVRFLIGTQEVMGRYRFIGSKESSQYALVLLDHEVVAAWGDHFIMRRYSPMDTMGGGHVLDLDPPLRGTRQREHATTRLAALNCTSQDQAILLWLEQRAPFGIPLRTVCQLFALSEDKFRAMFLKSDSAVQFQSGFVFHTNSQLNWNETIAQKLKRSHTEQPDVAGFSALHISSALPLLPTALLDWTLARLASSKKIIQEGALFKQVGAVPSLDARLTVLVDEVMNRLAQDGFAPSSSAVIAEALRQPKAEIEKALVAAFRLERAIRLGNDMFFDRNVFEQATERVKLILKNRGALQVSDLSKELNSSRKYVVPFLEYLDTIAITERRGNDRVPGRNFEKKN
ncbi:MAG: selenocysteine-specific translation elongation factor [bacterium]|nr:selenocysteine-specific translation elongation factor [bacterium]